MKGKRVQLDDATMEAIEAVARAEDKSFQELADVAFADLLKKYRQPVSFKAAIRESVTRRKTPDLPCEFAITSPECEMAHFVIGKGITLETKPCAVSRGAPYKKPGF